MTEGSGSRHLDPPWRFTGFRRPDRPPMAPYGAPSAVYGQIEHPDGALRGAIGRLRPSHGPVLRRRSVKAARRRPPAPRLRSTANSSWATQSALVLARPSAMAVTRRASSSRAVDMEESSAGGTAAGGTAPGFPHGAGS